MGACAQNLLGVYPASHKRLQDDFYEPFLRKNPSAQVCFREAPCKGSGLPLLAQTFISSPNGGVGAGDVLEDNPVLLYGLKALLQQCFGKSTLILPGSKSHFPGREELVWR
jgi:hypothetical protein